mmetsp:Transcript_3935/g.10169  ORF Transcript_3935/g.10169 Transcript_3935/m.10169 type:complete len:238 (-) Transcript_3935:184-897(-)
MVRASLRSLRRPRERAPESNNPSHELRDACRERDAKQCQQQLGHGTGAPQPPQALRKRRAGGGLALLVTARLGKHALITLLLLAIEFLCSRADAFQQLLAFRWLLCAEQLAGGLGLVKATEARERLCLAVEGLGVRWLVFERACAVLERLALKPELERARRAVELGAQLGGAHRLRLSIREIQHVLQVALALEELVVCVMRMPRLEERHAALASPLGLAHLRVVVHVPQFRLVNNVE